MEDVVDINFPVWALLPKKETGVSQFLDRYPEYDGRGVVIAIFDSGVDPGAPGMQVTSEGKPKIIERFDCSGAGDVDTSKVVQSPVDGIITGLTGRKLKIPDTWRNPTGNFHLGVKNAYSLYPMKLKERMTASRKKKLWDDGQKSALAEAHRLLQEFEAKNPNPTTIEEKIEKEELESRIEVLNNLEKKYVDVGPTYDIVVFHDGKMWRACIDTSEEGKLDQGVFLGEYSETHEYAPLTKEDQLNVSINVHCNGTILEIVSMASSHGTHVASIAAGNFPENPELNGIAPGAQIISLGIGDNRINTMETGTAIVRAMIKVMNYKEVHVINMSYGEHAHWSNAGRMGTLINEVVDKYGVTWVCSVGNEGPALCTVGTPPDISTNNMISVGAYVSPDMMVAEYSLREKMPGMPFTWSSRGPTIDGGFGATVCAPGAAITSVANFTLRKSQLMNGTSMSSPHVAGAIAVLISGLKARNLSWSPYSIKRSIENTALYIDSIDPFAQGAGLLQVGKAFENLVATANCAERDVRFSVSCGMSGTKGLHLRSGVIDRPKDYGIFVEPIFRDTDNIDPARKIDFNLKLSLKSEAHWVHGPSHMDLMHMPRSFSVRIDVTSLPEGVHNAEIRAYDVTDVNKGPVFRIPITAVKPTVIPNSPVQPDLSFERILFKPNTIKRHFILVPDDATWGVLRIKSSEKEKIGRFLIHTVQLKPRMSCKTLETNKMINVTSQAESTVGFNVQGGLIVEVAIAKYWANLGELMVDYTIEFHGIRLISGDLTMHAADGISRLELKSSLRSEEVVPSISLKNTVQVLRPIDAKIVPLGPRDVIPPARQIYELQLTYTFHIVKATEVTPNATMLSDVLYESEYESQLWMIYDSNKQLVASGDAYPSKYTIPKLEKGDYTMKMSVRHEKKELLERLNEMQVLLSQKLSSAVSLDVYASQSQALVGGKKMASASIPAGQILPLFVAPLLNDMNTEQILVKGVTLGTYLQGTITFCKDEIGKKVDVHTFKYVLTEPSKKNNNNKNDKEKMTKFEEYTEALRDLKCNWLAKLEPGEHAHTLYAELKSAFPDYLPVHTAMLTSLDSPDARKCVPQDDQNESAVNFANQIITVADTVIAAVDTEKLLAFYGLKNDQRPDAAKIKTAMEKMKVCLIESLAKKGTALSRIYVHNKTRGEHEENPQILERISVAWKELMKFAEPTDSKVIGFAMWHSHVNKHYGRYLKLLMRYYEDKPAKEVDEQSIEISKCLGWEHLARHISSSISARYPPAYTLF